MTPARARLAPALYLAATLIGCAAGPRAVVAQPATTIQPADASAIDRSRQRAHCDAELRGLKQNAGVADGQSDQAFMKTCLADVDPVAVLPGSASVMNAPVGSTGVCKDGTYASAVREEDACRAHGGLAHEFGQ